jgi:hypothetical protein
MLESRGPQKEIENGKLKNDSATQINNTISDPVALNLETVELAERWTA